MAARFLPLSTDAAHVTMKAMRPYLNLCISHNNSVDEVGNAAEFADDDRPLIKVAVKEYIPFIKVEEDEHGQPQSICGPMAFLLNDFAETFNVRYDFVHPGDSDQSSGSKLPDGSWNGILGMLQRQEADMSLFPMTATLSRLQAAKFSSPIDDVHYAIMSKNPVEDATIFNLSCVFDLRVLFGIVVGIALLNVANNIVTLFSDDEKRNHLINSYYQLLVDTLQNSQNEIIGHILRPATLLWVIVCFSATIGVAWYSEHFTKMLPNGNASASDFILGADYYDINTVQDLLNYHPNMWPVTTRYGALRDFLKVDPLKRYTKLNRRLVDSRGFQNIDKKNMGHILQEVASGKLALILSIHTLRHLRDKYGSCHFRIGTEKILPAPQVLGFSRNFPLKYLDWINDRIKSYLESGLLKEWKKELHGPSALCVPLHLNITNKDAIQLQDTKGLFAILLVGWILAVGCLLTQYIYKPRRGTDDDDVEDSVEGRDKTLPDDVRDAASPASPTNVPDELLEDKTSEEKDSSATVEE